MVRRIQLAALALGCATAWGGDQKHAAKSSPPPRPAAVRPNGGPRNPGGGRNPGAGKMGPGLTNPANPVARLYRASPEERERALEKLPAKMQDQFRTRLQWFDNLPPNQQRMVLNRTDRFAALPPERQAAIREQFVALNKLPQERKAAIGAALRRLEIMPDDQRVKVLESDQFKSRFSPEEQKIISALSAVMLPPP
jgi:hypothetical protein